MVNSAVWSVVCVCVGTYNNQYMVLDLKKVHLKESIDDNALWVVEQIPGQVIFLRTFNVVIITTIVQLVIWK